jgi:predicted metal-dependent hydrolase
MFNSNLCFSLSCRMLNHQLLDSLTGRCHQKPGGCMGTPRFKLHEDSVTCEGITLAYRYYLSRKRRTLGMSVHPDGGITVRSPVGVPPQAIRDFVCRQAAWIARVRRRFQHEAAHDKPASSAVEGYLYLGERYQLRVANARRETVAIRDGELVVTIRSEPCDPERVRLLCERWYRRQAEKLFRERLAVCQEQLRGEGIPLPQGLVIRTMRSRWGSYSYRTRRICLNLHLIKAPPACLDYVMIHELCHARVRHHGPDFWALVGRYVPDYRRMRELLKGYI